MEVNYKVIQRQDLLNDGVEIPAIDIETKENVHIVIDEPTPFELTTNVDEVIVHFTEKKYLIDTIDVTFLKTN